MMNETGEEGVETEDPLIAGLGELFPARASALEAVWVPHRAECLMD
jgi:hypothetical protein